MTAKFFVDTNVLVYAASNAVADQARRDVAIELLERTDLALSAQALAEFYSVATSKTKLNLAHEEAVEMLESLAAIPVCSISRELVMEAVRLRQKLPNQLLGCGYHRSSEANGLHLDLQRGSKFRPGL
jgi:predicted nucleic acid-binding protein